VPYMYLGQVSHQPPLISPMHDDMALHKQQHRGQYHHTGVLPFSFVLYVNSTDRSAGEEVANGENDKHECTRAY